MKYFQTSDPNAAEEYISGQLLERITKNEKILWLVSGGSAIQTAVSVSKRLAGHDLSQVSVSLVDERFGPVGHKDENWKQLLDNGFVLEGADLYRPLIGQDRHSTAVAYGDWLRDRFQETDYSIGLFGIGPDGHTAGIKPHSPAVHAQEWSVDYTHSDFERITMTFQAIQKLDQAVVQANGTEKFDTLHRLLTEKLPLDEQPAQVFQTLNQSILFTDYKEEAE